MVTELHSKYSIDKGPALGQIGTNACKSITDYSSGKVGDARAKAIQQIQRRDRRK